MKTDTRIVGLIAVVLTAAIAVVALLAAAACTASSEQAAPPEPTTAVFAAVGDDPPAKHGTEATVEDLRAHLFTDDAVPTPTTTYPPTQTVTEDGLRKAIDDSIYVDHARLFVEMLNDNWPIKCSWGGDFPCFDVYINSSRADHWDEDHTYALKFEWHSRYDADIYQPDNHVYIKLSNYSYTPGLSTVTEHDCQTSANGGEGSTGQFIPIDASKASGSVEFHHDYTVATGTHTETTTGQTFTTSAGVTVEAGTDVAKASATFNTELGLSKEQTSGKESSKEEGVGISTEVEAGHSEVVVFTTDNSGVVCQVDIDGVGDQKIEISCDGCNSGRVNHKIVTGSDRWKDNKLTFDSFDDMVRFMLGADVACEACKGFRWSSSAEESLDALQKPEQRHVVYSGNRTVATRGDGGYQLIDVTGADPDCVADEYSKPFTPVDDLPGKCT